LTSQLRNFTLKKLKHKKSDHEQILVNFEIIKQFMEFHPSKLPIAKVFDVNDEKDATAAAEKMVDLGFENKKEGYKVLMPKDQRVAKRIGFIITTSINYWLRKNKKEQDIRYWTYHHDKDHYAIVLISSSVLEELEF